VDGSTVVEGSGERGAPSDDDSAAAAVGMDADVAVAGVNAADAADASTALVREASGGADKSPTDAAESGEQTHATADVTAHASAAAESAAIEATPGALAGVDDEDDGLDIAAMAGGGTEAAAV